MTTKTIGILKIVCLAVCAIALLLLVLMLSWFYVRGAEFRFLEELPGDCKVTVSKQILTGGTEEPVQSEEEEITLTREQLDGVLTLLKKNAYWRMLKRTISFKDDTLYNIFFEFSRDSHEEYLIVTFVGGYAVAADSSVAEYATNGFLRTLNKDFLSKLEAIIQP